MEIRNITIIAHVDHGKTTLVDGLLSQAGAMGGKEVSERMMDSMDLEKERGITIKAKNASIEYKGTKINIIDTPGHADFGGEVERVLSMADTSLLLVDALDGPMPQTRFVLDKSLRLGHKPILVINKIDREFADPHRVHDQAFDLFDDLHATAEQHDFPVVYCSAKQGYASLDAEKAGKEDNDFIPILDLILSHVPPADVDETGPFQFQVMNLDYDDYMGRLSIGRIFRGTVSKNQTVTILHLDGTKENFKISKIFGFQAMNRVEVESAVAGDIVALAGAENINIGETIVQEGNSDNREPITVDEPTVSMYFMINDSPFSGKEGTFVTTRQLRDRLKKELLTNVALRVEEDPQRQDRFKVSGRGDLHLSVLVETLRREGFELQVSRPEVIMKEENGQKLEPFEIVIIDLPEEYSGTVINELNRRKGTMQTMETSIHGTTRIEYHVPTRGMIGFRSFLISESRGSAAINSRFLEYNEYAGPIPGRINGALISMENGVTVPFALFNIQERGVLFVDSGFPVYAGMVLGECARENDLEVNPCKEKKLTNMRASGSDEAVKIVPPRKLSLEQSLEFIDEDELVEVTPKSLRIRKKILNPVDRKRAAKK
ncbi:MAG: translational GTPase TypA [Spirochaetia bacterium]|nr:translational GTPase TypA [Spirochaetia bacterium]